MVHGLPYADYPDLLEKIKGAMAAKRVLQKDIGKLFNYSATTISRKFSTLPSLHFTHKEINLILSHLGLHEIPEAYFINLHSGRIGRSSQPFAEKFRSDLQSVDDLLANFEIQLSTLQQEISGLVEVTRSSILNGEAGLVRYYAVLRSVQMYLGKESG